MELCSHLRASLPGQLFDQPLVRPNSRGQGKGVWGRGSISFCSGCRDCAFFQALEAR
jgi:hypothetical protein